jgi:hypothetical protein
VQVDALNEPPAPLSLQAIEPGGEDGVELVSVTAAVYVIEFPRTTLDGFGETLVPVEWGGWVIVREAVPVLDACEVSPE